jgi:hypothetical protein
MPMSLGARKRERVARLAFTSARKGSAMVSALRRIPLGAGAGAGSVSSIVISSGMICAQQIDSEFFLRRRLPLKIED